MLHRNMKKGTRRAWKILENMLIISGVSGSATPFLVHDEMKRHFLHAQR